MKIIISESRIVQLMKVFLKKNYPSLLEPFKVESIFDDKIIYYDVDDDIVIVENVKPQVDLEDVFIYSRFEVNKKYMGIYNFFGKDAFEEFFFQVHNIDIRDPGKFKKTWKFQNYDLEIYGL